MLREGITEKMNKDRRIILASGSPRRIEMMRQRGFDPIVMPSRIEENLPGEMGMEQTVMFLALKKALSVETEYLCHEYTGIAEEKKYYEEDKANPLIIAADTIVYKDGVIGKPKDRADAYRILKKLCGTEHFVATGVAIIEAGQPVRTVFACVTKVCFANYSDAEIEAYIDTEEPYDKAGGYAIQGSWGRFVDYYEGDYDNVIGFPWSRIASELEKL